MSPPLRVSGVHNIQEGTDESPVGLLVPFRVGGLWAAGAAGDSGDNSGLGGASGHD